MSHDLAAWLDAVRSGVAAAAPAAGVFAQHVHVRPTTGSTNDDVARAALEGAPEGHAVVAAEQTAGRGRRGASWHSPAAHGLYLSVLLRPDRWPVRRTDPLTPAASLVTLMAGAAVASAVQDACGAVVELKWPNDVMVRLPVRPGSTAATHGGPPWRKLAGILAEGASDGGALRTVVLGVGLNVFRSPAPPDVADRMATLDELCAQSGGASLATVTSVVSALLAHLHEGVTSLSRGDLASVRARWRALAPSVDGTRVRWHHQDTMLEGHARGIDEIGALIVETPAGELVCVHGGEVDWCLEETT